MKIVDGFEFISVDGKMTAVSTGDACCVYNGIINLNETAYAIWKGIEAGLSIDEIASRLSAEYEELSIEDANKYVREFTEDLIKKGIVTEE